jgi:hypothetical protein
MHEPTRPQWDPPSRYGWPGAVQSIGGTAAPLLAGFSMTVMASVINSGEHYRWPGQTLLLLAAAVVLFIACMESAVWARDFSAHPSEITPWWLDFDDLERQRKVTGEQHRFKQIHDLWANRARWTYSGALLLLLLGLASALTPARTSPAPSWRWAAAGLVLAASLYEAVWIAVALTPGVILSAAPRPLRVLTQWIAPGTVPRHIDDRNRHSVG